jgi:hypothetical protein
MRISAIAILLHSPTNVPARSLAYTRRIVKREFYLTIDRLCEKITMPEGKELLINIAVFVVLLVLPDLFILSF